MENDIISLFLNRKRLNINHYTEIFSKHMLKKAVQLNKVINKIIEIYINNFYLYKNQDYSLLTKYFEIKMTKESTIKDVITSSLLFYQNSGLESQIESDINTIVVLSNLIYLAIKLDEYTNDYKHHDILVEERVQLFLDHFKNKIKLADTDTSLFEELVEQVKKDTNAEHKFWRSLVNKNFVLSFSRSLKNNNYFLVEYHYDLKMLYRYDEVEVKKTVLTKGINDDILTIYLEMLSVFILKNILNNNYDDLFFINIYSDYFTKNKDMLSILSIFSNKAIRQQLVFCFEFDDIKNNTSVAKTLHEKEFNIAVSDINDNTKFNGNSFDLYDYVFISSDLYLRASEYHDMWNVKKINFILDNSTFAKTLENRILTENR